MRKIKKNAAQCRLCGDIIESRYTHDFVMCKCKSCFVDGGLSTCGEDLPIPRTT